MRLNLILQSAGILHQIILLQILERPFRLEQEEKSRFYRAQRDLTTLASIHHEIDPNFEFECLQF